MRGFCGKSRNSVLRMIFGSGGSESRLAKAAGAGPCGLMRDEKCARCCSAKRISKSNAQNTLYGPLAEVRMLKSARRCGVKNVSKSKC